MANILTTGEAATVLRCEQSDSDMLDLLPLVDAYIKHATGRDWTLDAIVHPIAKAAARMLLVMWHENPGMIGGDSPLKFGLQPTLLQLEALALRYKTFRGSTGVGACLVDGASAGDKIAAVTGVLGATGDQSAAFESYISITGQIQQLSTSDLSANWYRAYLVPPEAL